MMYDVVIVGAGPAGLFCAYELTQKNPNLKILMLEKGRLVKNRVCPMNKNKTECKNCNPCNILSGYGGAGTFSDGKLNFIPKLGKSDLFRYMKDEEAYKLIGERAEELSKRTDVQKKMVEISSKDGKAEAEKWLYRCAIATLM